MAALEEIRAVYRELEFRPVERFCERRTECCRFKLTGLTPQLTKGEALLAAKAFRATGRTKLPERTDGACPMLDPMGKCLIYEARPFGPGATLNTLPVPSQFDSDATARTFHCSSVKDDKHAAIPTK
jgi:hypothetical protein